MTRDLPVDWNPKFLCYSIRGPIILSDGRVTTCTLDHEGQNAIGNIHEHDFETIVERYGQTRLSAMADPSSKPMCFKCYGKLPRWKEDKVPRADWINRGCSSREKGDFLKLFDPDAIAINLELSSNCNLRCIGCSVAKPEFKYARGSKALDFESLKKWMGGHGRRIAHVRLYHMGETWLHPQWDQICRFLKAENPGMTLFTSTNGMPMQVGNTIERALDSGIDHIMFSIHGAHQASAEKYMGTSFKLDVALKMAGQLAALRDHRGSRLYLSWKYVIFSWNDSEEEIREAKRLCDETGFDEVNFSITSQPSPSRRLAKGTDAWANFQKECASLWKRGAEYQKTAPMTALYPGRKQREHAAAVATAPAEDPFELPEGVSSAPLFASPVSARKLASLLSPLKSVISKALRRAPAGIRRSLNPGVTAIAEGRPAEGIRKLARISAAKGADSAEVRLRLGEANLALHRFEDARQNFERVIELQGGGPAEFSYLGLARAYRGLNRWEDAREAAERALQGRFSRGERAYGEDIYLELATILKRLGREEGVKTAWRLWREASYVRNTAKPASIYCPIPKNACTYLKTAFVRNSPLASGFEEFQGDAHQFLREPKNKYRLQNLDFLSRPGFFSFVVLRSPFDRLASAYSNLFVRPLKWHKLPDPSMRAAVLEIQYSRGDADPDVARSVTFEELIQHIAKTPDYDLDYHLRPQSAFYDRTDDFDFVGCVEDMETVRQVLADRLKWSFEGVGTANRTAYTERVKVGGLHRMSPHDLQKAAIFPTANDFFTDELRALVLERFANDFADYEKHFGTSMEVSSLR